jgi:hypothetical protein
MTTVPAPPGKEIAPIGDRVDLAARIGLEVDVVVGEVRAGIPGLDRPRGVGRAVLVDREVVGVG